MSRPAWLAWSLVAAAVLLTIPSVLALATVQETSFANWVFWFLLLEYAAVGGVIASRRPANGIGWLFIVGPLAVLVGFAVDAIAALVPLHSAVLVAALHGAGSWSRISASRPWSRSS